MTSGPEETCDLNMILDRVPWRAAWHPVRTQRTFQQRESTADFANRGQIKVRADSGSMERGGLA